MADYTHKNLSEVKDSAPGFGADEFQEARFAREDLQAEQTGLAHLLAEDVEADPVCAIV